MFDIESVTIPSYIAHILVFASQHGVAMSYLEKAVVMVLYPWRKSTNPWYIPETGMSISWLKHDARINYRFCDGEPDLARFGCDLIWIL
jgi:hypothetical protein